MLLFGCWAWDGYLFGAQQTGTMFDKIDDTYTHGFERRQDVSDTIYNLGGYPHGYYPSPTSPWNVGHARGGGGSDQHLWGSRPRRRCCSTR